MNLDRLYAILMTWHCLNLIAVTTQNVECIQNIFYQFCEHIDYIREITIW